MEIIQQWSQINDKAEIKKSFLQTTIDIKNKKNTTIIPDCLQESIGKAVSDLEMVDYSNDTSTDDLETIIIMISQF